MSALAGLRVLDLSRLLPGGFCTLLLADFGADVIKVEDTGAGDYARADEASFASLNRGKRSIQLNLKDPRGRDVLLRLVKDADVLTENYRRGTLEKLGVGYDVLSKVNPGLIYCAISGYGMDGPFADKGGFDLIAQGFAGLMSITGEPGRPPVKPGNPVADINAGLLAAMGIMAAYAHKLKTGVGQVVDTSLMEAALQQTYWHSAIYFATGVSPQPTGSAHVLTAPYQAFRAKDGWINIGGANQANWARLCDALGTPEWKADARFVDNDARMKNLPALVEAMNAVLVTRTRAEWLETLDAVGVPAGPVNTMGEALSHPQVLARGMVVEVDHPVAGTVKALGCPVHFSVTPTAVDRAAPLLGEHTRQVLRDCGYDDAKIDAFVAEGSVAESREPLHA